MITSEYISPLPNRNGFTEMIRDNHNQPIHDRQFLISHPHPVASIQRPQPSTFCLPHNSNKTTTPMKIFSKSINFNGVPTYSHSQTFIPNRINKLIPSDYKSSCLHKIGNDHKIKYTETYYTPSYPCNVTGNNTGNTTFKNIDSESELMRVGHYLPQEPLKPCAKITHPVISRNDQSKLLNEFHSNHRSFVTKDTPNIFNNITTNKYNYMGIDWS